MKQILDRIRALRIQEARGCLINFDPVDVDFTCPVCGQGLASVMVSLNEDVVITPLGEDHNCFEPLRFVIDDLFAHESLVAKAAVDAIEVYYSEREDEDELS